MAKQKPQAPTEHKVALGIMLVLSAALAVEVYLHLISL